MAATEAIRYEVAGRLEDLDLTKRHISVRYEEGPRIARVGACIEPYDWDHRDAVLDALLQFEEDHAADFAVEFDIIPLQAVTDPSYAEA